MALPFDREYLDLLWAGGDLSSEPPLGVPAEELMSVPPPPLPSGALLESYDVPEWRDVSHPGIEARAWEEDFYGRLASPGGEEAHEAGHGMFVEPLLNIAASAPGLMARSFGRRGGGELPPLTPDEERAALDAALMGVAGPVGRAGGKAWRWLTQTPGLTRPVPGGWRTAAGGPAHGPAPVAPVARSRADKLYDMAADPRTPAHEAASARSMYERLTGEPGPVRPVEAPPAAYETLAAEPAAAAAAPKSARVGMREAYKGIRAPRHATLEEGAYRGSGEYGKMRAKQSVHRDAVDSALTPEDVGVLKDYGRQFYPPGSSIFAKVDNVIAKAPKREEAIDLWRGETVGAPGDRFQRADLEALKPGDVLDLDRPRSADSTLSNVAANWMQGPDKVLFRFADNRNSIPAGLYTGIMDEHIVPSGKYVVKQSYYDTTTGLSAPYGPAWQQEQPARLVIELAAPAPAPGRPALRAAYEAGKPEPVAPEPQPPTQTPAQTGEGSMSSAPKIRTPDGYQFYRHPDGTWWTDPYPKKDEGGGTLEELIYESGGIWEGPIHEMPAEAYLASSRNADEAMEGASSVRGFVQSQNLDDVPPSLELPPLDDRALLDRHRQAVADALASGKHVPDEVLADYPALSPPPTQTPAFRRWFGESKVVDEKGEPMVVYHGTPYGFEAFSPGRSRGRWGSSVYFSDSPKDIEINYASPVRGRLLGLLRGDDPTGYRTIPVHLKMNNPVYLDPSGKKGTTIFGKEEKAKLLKALDDEAVRWEAESEVESIKGDIMDDLLDGTLTAVKLDKTVNSRHIYDPDTGDRASGGFVGGVFKRLGYDGIIADAYHFFGGAPGGWAKDRSVALPQGIVQGTYHYMVFDPTQIKSATGNVGTFDPKDPRIAYGIAGAAAAADED